MSDGIEKDGASRRFHMSNVTFCDAILEVDINATKVSSLTSVYACFVEAVIREAFIVSMIISDS